MSDVARVLEEVRRQVTAGPGAYDRLERRRRRRRAQRQTTTAVIALALSVLAIGGAIRIFEADRQLPADRIDRRTVGHLHPAWQARLGAPAIGHQVGGHHGHNVAVEPYAPVAVGSDVVAMTSGGRLVAFPAACAEASCPPRWTASVPNPAAGPLVVGDTVIALSTDGRISAYTGCPASTGACEPTWTGEISDGGAGPAGPPVASGGTVFGVATDGTVYAFDAGCRAVGGTCDPIWTAAMPTSGEVGHLTAPTVSGGLVFATDDLDHVYAFDAGSGNVRWTAAVERPEGGWPIPDTLAVAGDRVFATFAHTVYAFPVDCARRCSPAWHAESTVDGLMSAPVADSGMVLVKTWASPSVGHVLAFAPDCAANGETCEPVWSAIDHGWGDIVAADGVVYSTSYFSESVTAYPVACRPGNDCPPLWEVAHLGTPVSGPTFPTSGNGLLFVPTESGAVHVLPASCTSDCRPIRTFTPAHTARERSRSLSPPLVVGGRMWFVSADGHVFAYSLTD